MFSAEFTTQVNYLYLYYTYYRITIIKYKNKLFPLNKQGGYSYHLGTYIYVYIFFLITDEYVY